MNVGGTAQTHGGAFTRNFPPVCLGTLILSGHTKVDLFTYTTMKTFLNNTPKNVNCNEEQTVFLKCSEGGAGEGGKKK